jgi:hypothetical protein
VLCIREQLEAQAFFGAKLLVGGFVLHAYAENDRVFLFILPEIALKIVSFPGAAAREILGVEIEHDPFATEIVEAERFAVLRIQSEVRGRSPRGRRFLTGAHRANDGESEKQNDHNYEDPNHFHLAHSTVVLKRMPCIVVIPFG